MDAVVVHEAQRERDLPARKLGQVGERSVEEPVVEREVERLVFSRDADRDELGQRAAASVPRLEEAADPFGRRHYAREIGEDGHFDLLFAWKLVGALEVQGVYRRMAGEELS